MSNLICTTFDKCYSIFLFTFVIYFLGKMNSSLDFLMSYNDSLNKSQTFDNQSARSRDIADLVLNNYIGPILCVFGICGNILNLIILFKGHLNESPYLYLKILAMTDMCALLLSFIHMSISGKSKSHDWQVFNAYIFFPLVNFFMAASVLLTVGVTIDRFIFVKAPLWARSYCSIHRAKTRIVLILLFTILISVPRFFCYFVVGKDNVYTMKKTTFRSQSVYYQIYDFTCIALFHVSPLLILMFCNAYLICAVHNAKAVRQELEIRNNKEKDWQKDQRRFTITLISIVLLSIIAILPSTVGDFAQYFQISNDNYRKLRLSGNILLLCNLSMNFLLYCAFNKRFVRVMKLLFCGNHPKSWSPIRMSRSAKFSTVDTGASEL